MSRVIPVVLLTLAGCAPASTLAQEPIVETVVVTATATPVRFSELSRSVLVITREQIERLPVHSIDELLSYLASVDVRTRGPNGVQADISIRGASFTQALVLVDGIRLNDQQSAHHNADIPVVLQDVDRIELLAGPGASLYGADAVGGAVNVITRRSGPAVRTASVSAGAWGFVDGHVRVDTIAGGQTQSLAAAFSRSDGFTFDREFQTFTLGGRTNLGEHTSISLAHLDKDFGANGFYGPSPSREWTTQTLLTANHAVGRIQGWDTSVVAHYRTHGDHFLYDVRRPGQFENRHRTHVAAATLRGDRDLSAQTHLHVAAHIGGDWMVSNNLGDHAFAEASALTELRRRAGTRAAWTAGLRFDTYSHFGSSWSPSLAGSVWIAAPLKVRASMAHAFRIPTFTELYYRDPSNIATASLRPERGWSYEAGADWLPNARWLASATVFTRRDRDVIDWVRLTTQEPWRTANIRRVETSGIELGARRAVGRDGVLDVQYTFLSADPGPVIGLSKYVLDYARQRLVASASTTVAGQVGIGGRLGYTRRIDGREYTLLDLRVSRPFHAIRVFIEGNNLLDREYEEIRGVAMPGRWVRGGVEVLRF
jgi:outer membrane cobalamin receptor